MARRLLDRTKRMYHILNDLRRVWGGSQVSGALRTSKLSSLAGKPVAEGSRRSIAGTSYKGVLAFFYICS